MTTQQNRFSQHLIRNWPLYDTSSITTALEHLRRGQPTEVPLTISFKLRVSGEKMKVFRNTHMRIACMKYDVLTLLQRDLHRIAKGTTDAPLTREIIGCAQSLLGEILPATEIIAALSNELLVISDQGSGIWLAANIAVAIAKADQVHQPGLHWLGTYLEAWYEQKTDRRVDATMQNAANAKRKVKVLEGDVTLTEERPFYTSEQLRIIRFSILFRKLIQERVEARATALNIARLTEQSERASIDRQEQALLIRAISRRSMRQASAMLCNAILDTLSFTLTAKEETRLELNSLKQALDALLSKSMRDNKRIPASDAAVPEQQRRLLIFHIIEALNNEASIELRYRDAFQWLRLQLQAWIRVNPSSDDATIRSDNRSVSRLYWAEALRRFLEAIAPPVTDVLLTVNLAEKRLRGIDDGALTLTDTLSACYGCICTPYKYPLSSVLRKGVFSKCAEGVVGWAQQVLDDLDMRNIAVPPNRALRLTGDVQPNGKEISAIELLHSRRVSHLDDIYWLWLQEEAVYAAAAAREVPAGPDVGKALGDPLKDRTSTRKRRRKTFRGRRTSVLGRGYLGKRGARRILRWFLSDENLLAVLAELDVLLYPDLYESDRVSQARQYPHPYWVRRERRRLGAVRPSHQNSQQSNRPLRLGKLSRVQLLRLRAQLREQRRYKAQFDGIRKDIERFVEKAPPSFPYVQRPIFTVKQIKDLPFEARADAGLSYEERKQQYDRSVDWFNDFRPARSDPFAIFPPERLFNIERLAAQELEEAAAHIYEVDLQPIYFPRTMYPNYSPLSFTLLHNLHPHKGSEPYRFVFVCDLVCEEAEEHEHLQYKPQPMDKTNKVLPAAQQREFTNFPGFTFQRPPHSTFLFFPVEFGDKYQGRILREVVKRQRSKPQRCATDCKFAKTGKHLASCAQTAVLTTAAICMEEDNNGWPEWYVRLPVRIPVPPCGVLPTAIMGVHEDEGRYYFATTSFTGQLIEVGEISIPSHIRQETQRGNVNDNYVFELAHAIVRQSQQYTQRAFIGVEDTNWKRGKIAVSASDNRIRFSVPRQRTIEILQYKTAQAGILVPELVSGISPVRDCGSCGHHYEESRVRELRVHSCLYCQMQGQRRTLIINTGSGDTQRLICSHCGRSWAIKEPIFSCARCGVQVYAHYNTALAVARSTMLRLA